MYTQHKAGNDETMTYLGYCAHAEGVGLMVVMMALVSVEGKEDIIPGLLPALPGECFVQAQT